MPISTTMAIGVTTLGYIGPGPGLGALTALLGLLATILTALGAVLFWPLRALKRKWFDEDEEASEDDVEGDDSDGEEAPAVEDERDVEPSPEASDGNPAPKRDDISEA
jgi:hypothetical protein